MEGDIQSKLYDSPEALPNHISGNSNNTIAAVRNPMMTAKYALAVFPAFATSGTSAVPMNGNARANKTRILESIINCSPPQAPQRFYIQGTRLLIYVNR